MWFKRESKPQTPRPPLTAEAIDQKLRSFIGKNSKLIQPSELERETPLFSSGILDSLAFVKMVSFVEGEFGVSLSKAGPVVIENLDTMRQVIEASLKASAPE
ncbi:MAG: acyl carrier protein [Elusimicrobia bacterium]|nr:acyl carrier protein [Elusimicrobiota bacterium]